MPEGLPMIAVVTDEEHSARALTADLAERFGAQYDVVALGSHEVLDRVRSSTVAAVLTAVELREGRSGTDVLTEVHRVDRATRRVLLVGRGEWRAHPIRRAMVLGQVDGYVFVPWQPREPWLYLPLTEQLVDWSRTRPPEIYAASIVGRRWDDRSHALRDLFSRASIPYRFVDVDDEHGRAMLADLGVPADRLPVLSMYTGELLQDPTDRQVVELLGFRDTGADETCDVAIVGAGPAGMSAAVYAASEGLTTIVVDPSVPGGQAGTSSRIRNYLGFPRGLSGEELTKVGS